jgi:hypothetical protein
MPTVVMDHPPKCSKIEGRYYFLTLLSPSQRYQAANGSPQLALFFDRLFSLLNFFHATNHERRKIALHNLFFARFFPAKPLPRNLSLPLLRCLFVLGAYTGNCIVE